MYCTDARNELMRIVLCIPNKKRKRKYITLDGRIKRAIGKFAENGPAEVVAYQYFGFCKEAGKNLEINLYYCAKSVFFFISTNSNSSPNKFHQ